MEIVDTRAVLFQNFPRQNVKKCKYNNGFFVIDARVKQTSWQTSYNTSVRTTTVICRFLYTFDPIYFNLYKTKRSHLTITKSRIQEFGILCGNLS